MLKFNSVLSGNSSVVEHNLAKVGVASSNLVSRSILLLLIVFIPSFSFSLNNSYCLENQNYVDSKLLGLKENFKIIKIPNNSSLFKVPSISILTVLRDHNISLSGEQPNIITFKRNCNISAKKSEISWKLMEIFEKHYSCITFLDEPKIEPTSPLPYNFKDYKLIEISIKPFLLRKERGSLKAIYKTPKNVEKKIYFRYWLNATVKTFKAKHKLYNDKILTKNDIEEVEATLNELPSGVITCEIPKNLITKSYIKENSILSLNRFKFKKDILRGDELRVFVNEGALSIMMPATALSDANIGDILKVKTKSSKILKVKLISKYKAVVLE